MPWGAWRALGVHPPLSGDVPAGPSAWCCGRSPRWLSSPTRACPTSRSCASSWTMASWSGPKTAPTNCESGGCPETPTLLWEPGTQPITLASGLCSGDTTQLLSGWPWGVRTPPNPPCALSLQPRADVPVLAAEPPPAAVLPPAPGDHQGRHGARFPHSLLLLQPRERPARLGRTLRRRDRSIPRGGRAPRVPPAHPQGPQPWPAPQRDSLTPTPGCP